METSSGFTKHTGYRALLDAPLSRVLLFEEHGRGAESSEQTRSRPNMAYMEIPLATAGGNRLNR